MHCKGGKNSGNAVESGKGIEVTDKSANKLYKKCTTDDNITG